MREFHNRTLPSSGGRSRISAATTDSSSCTTGRKAKSHGVIRHKINQYHRNKPRMAQLYSICIIFRYNLCIEERKMARKKNYISISLRFLYYAFYDDDDVSGILVLIAPSVIYSECCKECFRKGLPNRLGIGSTDSC